MVSLPNQSEVPGSHASFPQAGPSFSGDSSTPLSGSTGTDGLFLERERLESLRCVSGVISALMSSRKSSSNKVWKKIWAKFVEFSSSAGIDLSLSISSIRVQVSTLLAFFRNVMGRSPLFRQYFCGATKLRPQGKLKFPKWDLPLILDSLTGPSSMGLTPLSIKEFSAKLLS